MPAPQPKPKYVLKGPRIEKVEMKLYHRDEDGMHCEDVTQERECYRLYIPHGPNGEMNSIRIISNQQLVELGVDPNNTPLVDPETGETVGTFQHRAAQDYGPDPVITRTKKGAE